RLLPCASQRGHRPDVATHPARALHRAVRGQRAAPAARGARATHGGVRGQRLHGARHAVRGGDARHPGARGPVGGGLRRHQVQPVRAATADHDQVAGRAPRPDRRDTAVRPDGRDGGRGQDRGAARGTHRPGVRWPPGSRRCATNSPGECAVPLPRASRFPRAGTSPFPHIPPFPRASRAERGHLMRVLLCGESWVTHSLHIKGVDSFSTSSYVEGAGHLRAALAGADIEVDYLPGHLVPEQFPATLSDLLDYQAVILSDIGANSILLAPQTFEQSRPAPDRLAVVEEYVRNGGGLMMIGGYLSFAGIEGKARYHGTPGEGGLPLLIRQVDGRGGCARGGGPRT